MTVAAPASTRTSRTTGGSRWSRGTTPSPGAARATTRSGGRTPATFSRHLTIWTCWLLDVWALRSSRTSLGRKPRCRRDRRHPHPPRLPPPRLPPVAVDGARHERPGGRRAARVRVRPHRGGRRGAARREERAMNLDPRVATPALLALAPRAANAAAAPAPPHHTNIPSRGGEAPGRAGVGALD